MTRSAPPRQITFEGASHNALVADRFGEHGASVMLLHGGGQTRHAWHRTASRLATEGFTAFAIDQRGHGDSAWIADGDYAFTSFAADAAAIAQQICKLTGSTPIAIGASLGGIASLLAEGEASDAAASLFSALVLVDITPRVDPGGVAKIHDFMRAHAQQGFASVAEAAASVAAYLPHRPTPKTNDGLKKNLRLHPDGRWRWHWDPAFLNRSRGVPAERDKLERALLHAATKLRQPVLLVRGASSELVHQVHVDEFLTLVPHAEFADVAGARHMVAGDRNDVFSSKIIAFCERVRSGQASPGIIPDGACAAIRNP